MLLTVDQIWAVPKALKPLSLFLATLWSDLLPGQVNIVAPAPSTKSLPNYYLRTKAASLLVETVNFTIIRLPPFPLASVPGHGDSANFGQLLNPNESRWTVRLVFAAVVALFQSVTFFLGPASRYTLTKGDLEIRA